MASMSQEYINLFVFFLSNIDIHYKNLKKNQQYIKNVYKTQITTWLQSNNPKG